MKRQGCRTKSKFEPEDARDLFGARQVSQHNDYTNDKEDARPRRRRKAQPEPDDDNNVMGGRETMTCFHAMKLWAQQSPEKYTEEAMKMWKSKVKAKIDRRQSRQRGRGRKS